MDESNPAVLVALELIRRQLADMPQAFARNLQRYGTAAPPAPAYNPINPAHPGVVMTPTGPAVSPAGMLAPRMPAPRSPTPTPPPLPPQRITPDRLAAMQKEAAADLAAAAKAGKTEAAKPERSTGAKALAAMGGLLGGLGKAVSAILPPMHLWASILGSSTSGVSLVSKAFQLLAAVLAPVLMPILALFAAGLLYLSDLVMKHVWPAFQSLWKAIGPGLVGAFQTLADVVGFVARALSQFLKDIGVIEKTPEEKARPKGLAETMVDNQRKIQEAEEEKRIRERLRSVTRDEYLKDAQEQRRKAGLPPLSPDRLDAIGKAWDKANPDKDPAEARKRNAGTGELVERIGRGDFGWLPGMGGGKAAPPPAGGNKPGEPDRGRQPNFIQALRDIQKVFQMSNGPQASFGEIGASQVMAAQLALLNTDPIEARMLEAIKMTNNLLTNLIGAVEEEEPTHKKGP